MTKELLLARRADLETRLAAERETQAKLKAEIARLQTRMRRSLDQENALGGAIQDVDYWAATVLENREAAEQAKKASK